MADSKIATDHSPAAGPTPLEQVSALEPTYYTRSDVYGFELENIIRPYWQIVGPASGVSGSGDVMVREIADVPIIIVRDNDGMLRGFYNICQHRAGPLATCDLRGAKRLKCAYHGWSYHLNGKLAAAPEMQEALDFDVDKIGLTPIEVVEWNGMVFARLAPGPSFTEIYSEVEQIAGAGAFESLTHHTQVLYEVASNWKIYVDNFLEGYHLPFVHPSLTRLVSYKDYDTDLGKWWSLQRSPVEESGPYAAGEGLYFYVYPTTMLNIMPGRIQTNRVIPTGLTTCQVEFDFYYAPGAETRAEEDLKFSDLVQEEDRMICEHVQKGLTSGVYSPGRLSPKREAGVWHFQNLLREAYRPADL